VLRDYFPKGTDLAIHTADDLAFVQAEVNRRPPGGSSDGTPQNPGSLTSSEHPSCCDVDWNPPRR